MGVDVIVQQLIMMSTIALVGYIGVKTKYVSADLRYTVSKLILRITMPLLNLTVISGRQMNPELMKNAAIVIISAFCLIVVMVLLGLLVAKLFKMPPAIQSIHTCMSAFGNVGFMGYPLMQALFGAEGLFYAVMYGLVHDLLFWTLGLLVIAKAGGGSVKGAAKKLLNPVTLSYPVALLMLALGLKFPELLNTTLSTVGNMTTPLAMLFVGMALATISAKGILKQKSIYIIVALKMLLLPAGFALFFKWMGISGAVLGVIILQTAIPAQSSLGVVAEEHAAKAADYATQGIFITTILSLVTLPILYALILHLG